MRRAAYASLTLLSVAVSTASAGSLYSQNFEVDPTGSWTVHSFATDSAVNFFFDYSTVGVPPAPNGAGTRGMKLQANLVSNIFGGVSASPNGQSFAGDYTVRFDWWANFNGPFPGGGNGATHLSTFGVCTAGASPQSPGATVDSVFFAATGDGGSASDYRAYSSAAPTSYAAGNAVYAAPGGAINNSDPYYAGFGGVGAPAAQLALFPQQSGTTSVGTAGMAWHEVLIATIDLNTVTVAGGNIFFGHSDTNAQSSTDPNAAALLFTLIDNIVVIPEPGTLALLALGGLALLRRVR